MTTSIRTIPRSPSIDRICAAAITHFAERGYDAASLNDIATAVGIRKASLYAHFSGKDALFMEAFADALQMETEFAAQCFATERAQTLPGSRYCKSLVTRYAESEHLRFLLRTAYLPPTVLQAQISIGYENYLSQLLAQFTARLQDVYQLSRRKDINLFGQAYLGIVDSLHVELIYTGGKNFNARLQALSYLLTQTLSQVEQD